MRKYSYEFSGDKKYDDFSMAMEVRNSGCAIIKVAVSGANIKFSDYFEAMDYYTYIIDRHCNKEKLRYSIEIENKTVVVKITSYKGAEGKNYDKDNMSKDIAIMLGSIT